MTDDLSFEKVNSLSSLLNSKDSDQTITEYNNIIHIFQYILNSKILENSKGRRVNH